MATAAVRHRADDGACEQVSQAVHPALRGHVQRYAPGADR